MENVEKVVKLPTRPTVKPAMAASERGMSVGRVFEIKARRKDPTTLMSKMVVRWWLVIAVRPNRKRLPQQAKMKM